MVSFVRTLELMAVAELKQISPNLVTVSQGSAMAALNQGLSDKSSLKNHVPEEFSGLALLSRIIVLESSELLAEVGMSCLLDTLGSACIQAA